MRAKAAALFCTVLSATMAAACSPGPVEPETNQTEDVEFAYPPLQFYTDIAIPLDGHIRTAAEFALAAAADRMRILYAETPEEVRDRHRSQAAPEAYSTIPPDPRPFNVAARTGGLTKRVVDAKELDEHTVELTICTYESPGEYTVYKDGRTSEPLAGQMHQYSLRRPRVQWTDRPAADGTRPSSPRWLWVDGGFDPNMTLERKAPVCEPFKPDPFIQKMPDPIRPSTSPTR
jgi:hypothetical protein